MQEQQQDQNSTTEIPLNFPLGSPDQLPTLAEWNAKYIDYILNYTKGKKTAAARILGINRRTLYRRNKTKSEPVAPQPSDQSQH
jgi:DNA-binding NtrC family response regulator